MSGRRPLPLRDAAVQVAERLLDAGFVAYFAGGCVRDRLLGGMPDDYDIATDAPPEEVRKLFPSAQGVGESFGVMLVRGGGHVCEVATFRADGSYADGRRPSEVRYTVAEEDARRRDFTINGLFEEPRTGRIVDFVGGVDDLQRKLIRAIGDPHARFAEDHLRLLRAVRFAARLDFTIDPTTADAAVAHAERLSLIARERVGAELRRMLDAPGRVRAIELLHRLALDGPTLEEAALGAIALPRTTALPDDAPFGVVLAAWGLDRGGSAADAVLTEGSVERWRSALVLSNREEESVREIVTCRLAAFGWGSMGVAARKRWAARPGSRWVLAMLRAERPDLALAIHTWWQATDPATIAPTRLIGGDDLVRLGLPPGPAFRDLLEASYDAQLEGRCSTKDDAIRFVRSLIET